MPEPWQCKICPNYPFCATFRGEENMAKNPCPYEVLNGKVEKPTAPSIIVERLK